ncbi:carbon-nitrogen hydrolase family protein [Microlunatus lacustris]
MTANRSFKRRVRARAARTGEAYTAALRHLRTTEGATVPTTRPTAPATLRLAVAQTTFREDPADTAGFHAAGTEVRALMRAARAQGADLVHFPEATLCFPGKLALSSRPGQLAEADWQRFDWQALQTEITAIRATARELGLWTVLGAQHRGPGPSRPRTSLFVLDRQGRPHRRYDERLLSRTKQTYLYEPGLSGTTFEVGSVRFGCTSGLEVLFPDLYSDYEADGVDCVLYSTAGPSDPAEADSLASSARTHALQNGLWISYAVPSDKAPFAAAGVLRPGGTWAARCPERVVPAVVVVDIGPRPDGAARDWRRTMLVDHRTRAAAPGQAPAPVDVGPA